MFWFGLVVCLILPPLAYLTRRVEAERQLRPLLGTAWEPDGEVLDRARDSLARQQIFMTTGSAAGALLILLLLEAASDDPIYGLVGFGFVSGAVLGNIVGHLSAGRITAGASVAGAAPRRLRDYLSRAHVAAFGMWAGMTMVAAPVAVLGLDAVRGPAEGIAVLSLLGVATVWLVAVVVMTSAVLRRRTTARSGGDLAWQEWMRARVVSDVVGSLWLSVCSVGSALWIALLTSGGSTVATGVAGSATALAVVGLVVFWVARTRIPTAVKTAVTC
ncbi:hypothetical protein [Serinicoccus kebangsaanensis]|uniref:hypothetical protein n=1 Tax=Serinicoccus kebangsaanensis TaxID=2602069 RepID=UPI00124E88B7|nr:hypothetical protein [Serinicoccus kebangsaanensis]